MSSARASSAAPIVGTASPSSCEGHAVSASRGTFDALVSLTKPRLTTMVAFSGLIGFVLARPVWDSASLLRLVAVCLGTLLIVGSANAFNQILERHEDGRMHRTASRPIPSGRLDVRGGLIFASAIGIGGVISLWAAHWLSAVMGMVALAIYVAVYTPLKSRSPWSTAAGAVSGAIPPLMGAFAATGGIDVVVWFACALLFLWQFPHTWSIAVLHRDDYERVGHRLLPLIDGGASKTRNRVILYTLGLIGVSFVPALIGITGLAYLTAAAALGLLLLRAAGRFAFDQSPAPARSLLLATLVYLPVLLTLVALGRSVI